MPKNWVKIAVIGVIVLFLAVVLGSFNAIPTKDEATIAAWSQVTNQYKRRADLIPNLVNTVKGFAAQEKNVLTAVVEARAKVSQMKLPDDVLTNPEAFKQFQQQQGALSSALSRLLVVVERYPELKSNRNFLTLQSQLEGTENRISVARRDYINAVRAYNTELRTFPGVMWASVWYKDARRKQNFAVDDTSITSPPTVKFN